MCGCVVWWKSMLSDGNNNNQEKEEKNGESCMLCVYGVYWKRREKMKNVSRQRANNFQTEKVAQM